MAGLSATATREVFKAAECMGAHGALEIGQKRDLALIFVRVDREVG